MQTAGIKLYRARVQMNCVQARDGFDFGATATTTSPTCTGVDYDALVGALAAKGITFLPVLINYEGTTPLPPNNSTGANPNTLAPTVSAFAAFAVAVLARYGVGGSFWMGCGCTPHPVEAYEVWNEENVGAWWGDAASARAYAHVFKAVQTRVQALDVRARAVVGGLADFGHDLVGPTTMIKALYAQGIHPSVIALHIYSSGRNSNALAAHAFSPINALAKILRTLSTRVHAPRPQIWVTELGWPSEGQSELVADAVNDFFARARRVRARDDLGVIIWYAFRDNTTLNAPDDELGLRTTLADGEDGGPKNVWFAFISHTHAREIALPR
jgi:hypothetical protein